MCKTFQARNKIDCIIIRKGSPMKDYDNNHTVCVQCRSFFPRSWLHFGKAVRHGKGTFCSETCRQKFIQEQGKPTVSGVRAVLAHQPAVTSRNIRGEQPPFSMDRKTRDKQIYINYKSGMTIRGIARKFRLKQGRIVNILCNNSNQYNGEKLRRMIVQLENGR